MKGTSICRMVMMAVIILTAVMAPSATARTEGSEPERGPLLSFAENTIDFGVFNGEEVQNGVLKFTNTGDKPLLLLRVFSDCGCTVASYDTDTISPGSTGEIRVKFDGRGRKPGYFRKTIRVKTNNPDALSVAFVKGVVKPPMRK